MCNDQPRISSYMIILDLFYVVFCSGNHTKLNILDTRDIYSSVTVVPPCCLAVIFWDIQADLDGPEYERLLPKLYYIGQFRKKFNIKLFTLSQCQALFDSAVIFFICFQPIYKYDQSISNADFGCTVDKWEASVTAFTALIFVVHFNLYTRMKYITWLHALSIFALSILPYIIYMWIGNYLPDSISQTRFAVMQAHKTLIFYVKIACCIAWSFGVDYALDCWAVLITENPTDYLRYLLYKGLSITNKANKSHFNALVNREEAAARVKNSHQRKLMHLQRIQMRQKLSQVHTKRQQQSQQSQQSLSSTPAAPPTPTGKEDSKRVFPSANEQANVDSLRAQNSASSIKNNPQNVYAGQGGYSSSNNHTPDKNRGVRTQNSALGTIRDALHDDLERESSNQSSSVNFPKGENQSKMMNGSSVRISPSN